MREKGKSEKKWEIKYRKEESEKEEREKGEREKGE